MRVLLFLVAGCTAATCAADDQAIQRAIIQRDQQSAEFAAGVRGGDRAALEALHARQLRELSTQPLHPDPGVARQLQPYQRQKMADERALLLPPPVVREIKPAEKPAGYPPLPLPRGPGHVVDPIPAQGTPH
jgi:hypothetical protein